jgi:hypothetical protein
MCGYEAAGLGRKNQLIAAGWRAAGVAVLLVQRLGNEVGFRDLQSNQVVLRLLIHFNVGGTGKGGGFGPIEATDSRGGKAAG